MARRRRARLAGPPSRRPRARRRRHPRGARAGRLRHQHIGLRGVQRREGGGLHIELGQHAHFAQQQQLEGAQGRLHQLGARRGQHPHGGGVGVEQGGVGVVAREQAQQQLVEVGAREQRLARGHHMAADPFGGLEGADLRIAAEAQAQRLQRQQHGAEVRARPLGALGHQGHAPVVAGEHLEDQAGLAPVVAVQHIGGLVVDALHRGRRSDGVTAWDTATAALRFGSRHPAGRPPRARLTRSRRRARALRRRPSPSAP